MACIASSQVLEGNTWRPYSSIALLSIAPTLNDSRFYADLLGVDADGDCIRLFDGGLEIWFQKVENYQPSTWPTQERGQQMHFDLHTDDRETEVIRAVAMGATIESEQTGFTVMKDPAGHPFCICNRQECEVRP